MLMELQGKKKTRDFLSLYTKDSSCQLQDSRSHPPQGFLMKTTHDFLQPLETAENEKARRGPTQRTTHVLPGGIGTYSISHVSSGASTFAAVKPESNTCGPDAAYAFPVWDAAKTAGPTTGQWPSTFAALSPPSFGSLASSRSSQFPDKKQRFMESASRFSKGLDDDDDDDEELGRRESSSHKELTGKSDGKTGEQKACTPRSKHSATEQRRRSKINDRFQILRGLLPNSDQKRDKASFLLEVIEYIQFLQEKLQKYESSYPGWSDETVKLMPWNNNHGSGDGMVDPQVLKNGTSSGLMVSDSSIPVAPSILSSAQNPTESELIAGVSYKELENPNGFSSKVATSPASLHPNLYPSVGRGMGVVVQPQQRLIPETAITGSQSEWLRSSFHTGCTASNDEINEQELIIDEGTITVSSEYSQGLLNSLSQALQNSGVDLSQASISVHINLGRRASVSRRNASSMATPKEQDEPLSNNIAMSSARLGNKIDESEQATKRHKADHN
ncbi:transcription factor BIM2-like isoform X2 [Phalaenopsis equestris]|uniref:transcription factor BIM2-like isoform X2 n=1 Tax=Phalaenopsis equestris TaxID=78828 RepID=UPI0009E6441A|nr:transcription factor BIM2-like isoform X2 [Phalaenopsis equestris]